MVHKGAMEFRSDYITGPGGAPYGSFGPVILCGVAAQFNLVKSANA